MNSKTFHRPDPGDNESGRGIGVDDSINTSTDRSMEISDMPSVDTRTRGDTRSRGNS